MNQHTEGSPAAEKPRIVVVADDFTGAAEVAGVAHRYGLRVELQTELAPASTARVIVLDADTRSCSVGEAVRRVRSAAEGIRTAAPELFYKKVDSVLRGHVVAETIAVMETLGVPRALIVPANPSLGRVIRNGRYLVENVPIHETDFALDPEYPRRTSEILQMLDRHDAVSVRIAKPDQVALTGRIVIGEATRGEDLITWAERSDDRTLPVGGAEFFEALLDVRGFSRRPRRVQKVPGGRPALLVCGTSSAYSRDTINVLRENGVPVLTAPEGRSPKGSDHSQLIKRWAEDVSNALESNAGAVVVTGSTGDPAGLLQRVLRRCSVRHLFIEGGMTASIILRRLGWRRMRVCAELSPGVVSLESADHPDLAVTTKPGSYRWPDSLLKTLME